MEGDSPQPCKGYSSQSDCPEKNHRKAPELKRLHPVSHSRERRQGRATELLQFSPQSRNLLVTPQELSGDRHRRPALAYVACQRPGEGHSAASQHRPGLRQEGHQGGPKGKELCVKARGTNLPKGTNSWWVPRDVKSPML